MGCFVFYFVLERMNQRGEALVSQGLLPIKYEEEKRESGLTGLAGLPLYVEFGSGNEDAGDDRGALEGTRRRARMDR